jgi:hypothetical protein
MPKAPFAWTKPGLELEVGIGDFEHLAAPFRLRGKVRELAGDELVVTASNHCDKWRVTTDDDEHYLFAVAL